MTARSVVPGEGWQGEARQSRARQSKIAPVSDPAAVYTSAVAAPADETLSALKEAAEDWGASWEPSDASSGSGGKLHLPVIAGLRRGFEEGHVTVEDVQKGKNGAKGDGCSVRFQVERSSYRLWTPAILLLLVAAWGGIISILWPFWPSLLSQVPIGLVLAFSAWFLIVPRLRNEGAEDFLAMVGAYAEGEPEVDPEADPDMGDGPPALDEDLGTDLTGQLPGRWNGEVR